MEGLAQQVKMASPVSVSVSARDDQSTTLGRSSDIDVFTYQETGNEIGMRSRVPRGDDEDADMDSAIRDQRNPNEQVIKREKTRIGRGREDHSTTEQELKVLKAEIKAWERSFRAAHGGANPGKEDIKREKEMAAKYSLYRKLTRETSSSSSQAPRRSNTPSSSTLSRPDRYRSPSSSSTASGYLEQSLIGITSASAGTSSQQAWTAQSLPNAVGPFDDNPFLASTPRQREPTQSRRDAEKENAASARKISPADSAPSGGILGIVKTPVKQTRITGSTQNPFFSPHQSHASRTESALGIPTTPSSRRRPSSSTSDRPSDNHVGVTAVEQKYNSTFHDASAPSLFASPRSNFVYAASPQRLRSILEANSPRKTPGLPAGMTPRTRARKRLRGEEVEDTPASQVKRGKVGETRLNGTLRHRSPMRTAGESSSSSDMGEDMDEEIIGPTPVKARTGSLLDTPTVSSRYMSMRKARNRTENEIEDRSLTPSGKFHTTAMKDTDGLNDGAVRQLFPRKSMDKDADSIDRGYSQRQSGSLGGNSVEGSDSQFAPGSDIDVVNDDPAVSSPVATDGEQSIVAPEEPVELSLDDIQLDQDHRPAVDLESLAHEIILSDSDLEEEDEDPTMNLDSTFGEKPAKAARPRKLRIESDRLTHHAQVLKNRQQGANRISRASPAVTRAGDSSPARGLASLSILTSPERSAQFELARQEVKARAIFNPALAKALKMSKRAPPVYGAGEISDPDNDDDGSTLGNVRTSRSTGTLISKGLNVEEDDDWDDEPEGWEDHARLDEDDDSHDMYADL